MVSACRPVPVDCTRRGQDRHLRKASVLRSPSHVYSTGVGGGALIVDRFVDDEDKPQEKSDTGQRRAADEVEMGTA